VNVPQPYNLAGHSDGGGEDLGTKPPPVSPKRPDRVNTWLCLRCRQLGDYVGSPPCPFPPLPPAAAERV